MKEYAGSSVMTTKKNHIQLPEQSWQRNKRTILVDTNGEIKMPEGSNKVDDENILRDQV